MGGCTISSTSASNAGVGVYNATAFTNDGSLLALPITNIFGDRIGYDFRVPSELEIQVANGELPGNEVLLGCSNPFYDLLHMGEGIIEGGLFTAMCNVEREKESGQSGFIQFATVTDSDLDTGLF